MKDKVRLIPWLALALMLGFAPAARAEVFEIPEDESVVSVAVPDGWAATADAAAQSVNGVSADGALQLRFAVVDAARAVEAFEALVAADAARGLAPDRASEAQSTLKIAARRASDLSYRLAGPGGLQKRIIRMELAPGKLLFISFTGTAAAFTAHADAIRRIFEEVKPLDN